MWQTVRDNFSLKGLLVVAVTLVPSVLLAIFPPQNSLNVTSNLASTILENIGRFAVIAILLFSARRFDRRPDVWFGLACIFGLLYYVGWGRYFFGGQTFRLLYEPIFHIPVPLAVFPVLALVAVAIWMRSIALVIAVLVMAVGHVPASYLIYREVAR